ncbi:P1 family peptidase [Parasedimentitalea huanghaiensis]|uniref:S58 family peptidase n=1 Tax=Parasedimentitalea huanghaiensis TaxID=2682100 RepID=A0A6L6WME5_9RHOB|nr:P1 family peptidase [Zongyanglinia huanghaiensis]MVO16812.1 S58 family peptidase [Zongyanglinia huanghaiensis]
MRAREHGIKIGRFAPGPLNAITDVAGVKIGHVTLIEGERTRTGATAILPHSDNVFTNRPRAGLSVLNGFGKFAGATQVQELGELETPILLTNTLATGRAVEALVQHTLAHPENKLVTSINAVVGETNDGRLNDIRAARPTIEEMRLALSTASKGPVAEGAVGAGTGTISFGLKGGIGTASRLVEGHSLGVLVQSNFGGTLRVNGQELHETSKADADGSIVIVIATDAPLCARNLTRLATRSFAGLARIGSSLSNGSGDYALAFTSTSADMPNDQCSPLFEAVIEATEEAILNALLAARDMQGYDALRDRPNLIRSLKL